MMRSHDAVSDKVVCIVHAVRDIDSCRLGRSTTLEVDKDLLDSDFLCFLVVLHNVVAAPTPGAGICLVAPKRLDWTLC
jgi:hypothetical protein